MARIFGAAHEYAIVAAADLALTLSRAGHHDAALEQAQDAVACARAHLPAAHPQRAGTLVTYGRCLGRAGRTRAALDAIEEGRAALVAVFGADHAVLAQVTTARAEVEALAANGSEA